MTDRHPGPRIIAWGDEDGPLPMLRDEMALAVYWCRFGALRPQRDTAFVFAHEHGLLVGPNGQGMVFATTEGEQHLARALFDAPYREIGVGGATGHPAACSCERCSASWAAGSSGMASARRELEQGAAV